MTSPSLPPIDLPPLDDDHVVAMERRIFARIAETARVDRRRRRARIGGWSAAAAAVVLVAAIAGPSVIGGGSGSLAEQYTGAAGAADSAPELDTRSSEGAVTEADADAPGREIVANGSVTLEVSDVNRAIAGITDAATSAGGYVESSQIGAGSALVPIEGVAPRTGLADDPSSAWITVRVPAERLTSVTDGLSALGTVSASSVMRSDVTDQAVDLRARVAAAEASVARLTELMSQAASVADLIAAESALADRQARLDSDRQQLALLESQVAMSSLSVQVVAANPPVAADPAGFTDGLLAGWNGLVAALNGFVVGLGFLLPWLSLAAVIAAGVWLVRRARRRRASGTDT